MYLDHIRKHLLDKEDIFKKIVAVQRKNHPFDSIETLSFNRIECSYLKHFSLIEQLAKDKSLYYGQILLCFSKGMPELCFHLEEKPDYSAVITAFFQIEGEKCVIDKLFWDAGFFVSQHTVYEIQEYKRDYSTYFEKISLLPEAKERFLEKLEEEGILYERVKATPLSKVAILRLTDPRGLFSKVCVEYSEYGEIIVGIGKKNPARDYLFEDSLLQDLSELGFVEKLGGMYIPLDQLQSSLCFLLEMGWKVFDFQKREVVLGQNFHLQMELLETEQIEAQVFLDQEELSAENLAMSCRREDVFCPLTSSSVMLIDPKLKKAIAPLLKASSLRENRLLLSKNQLGFAFDEEDSGFIQKGDRLKALIKMRSEKHNVGLGFRGKLLPYQEKGLSWLLFLYKKGFSGILADEMGLGKTVQVIAFLSKIENKEPHLIVVPAFLLFNWKKEIDKFLPGRDVYTHHGSGRTEDLNCLQLKDIILTSYQTLRQDLSIFEDCLFSTLILDEAMAIKNEKSQVAIAACKLNAFFRLCITATPLENRVEELFSVFHFLDPGLTKCWKMDPELLSKEITPYLLRRLKKDVEIDLPHKIVQDLWVEMSPAQELAYEEFLKGKKDHLEEKNALEILTIILRLRQIAAHPALVDPLADMSIESSSKLVLLFQEIEELFSGKHKVLIFSQFTSLLQIIQKEVVRRGYAYYYLDGKVSIKEKEKRIEGFQNASENTLFLISLKAGGVGLNLTGADYVYILDPWWNEKIEDQAINRAHRIGQKRTVIAKRLYTQNSIEEKIHALKAEKSSLFDKIIENSSTIPLEREDLVHLLD